MGKPSRRANRRRRHLEPSDLTLAPGNYRLGLLLWLKEADPAAALPSHQQEIDQALHGFRTRAVIRDVEWRERSPPSLHELGNSGWNTTRPTNARGSKRVRSALRPRRSVSIFHHGRPPRPPSSPPRRRRTRPRRRTSSDRPPPTASHTTTPRPR